MAELGPDSPHYHEEIGAVAKNLGVDVVIGVGELARGYGPDDWCADPAAAIDMARTVIHSGDCVLVKGSRSAGLERVADALATVAA
jgi:UDP-N-acetylmuramoyl-tripeptide--D-alanyl-D-alanine ligase